MNTPFSTSARRMVVGILLAIFVTALGLQRNVSEARYQVIVQGVSVDQATQAVKSGGGTVLKALGIINGVSASVPASRISQLTAAGLRVSPDYGVESTSNSNHEQGTSGGELYPSVASETTALGHRNITGAGVTIAYIDSGFPALSNANQWDAQLDQRTLYAAKSGRFVVYRDLLHTNGQMINSSDPYGHGTHIVMTSADNRKTKIPGKDVAVGIAPDANIVMVRALDANGRGSYSTVIEAIDWIVAHQNQYNIRVLNLSLDGYILAPYWADPLNQAVMKAWQSNLVVVAAAGNRGPEAMTVGVPGNNPYVITAGAIKSGRYTTSGNDQLATYSGAGPTESRFVKPDVVVPASQSIAVMPISSHLASSSSALRVEEQSNPALKIANLKSNEYGYYKVSGTSMASAQVSGIAALLLQDEPNLTNNQVKHRLTSTALAAGDANGAGYSIWQQGAGRVQAVASVDATTTGAANQGMNIQNDLNYDNGTHYLGFTVYDDATNTFYLQHGSGSSWSGSGSSWSGSGSSWSGSGSSWSGSGSSWSGSGSSWSGSGSSWSGMFETWSGAGSSWSGAGSSWSGAGSSWSGAGSSWSGAGSSWSGAGSSWSGARAAWNAGGSSWSGAVAAWNAGGSSWSGAGSAWSGAGSVWSGMVSQDQ